jgi:hypothetical protein
MKGGERYVKLFASITESTIWTEPAGTRLTWIAMLARANMRGEVFASIPGLARLANVSLQECEAALRTLLSPDPYSRTPDFEGRRIEPIAGGWRLLNFVRFDRARNDTDAAEREAERKREWDREHRGNRPNSKRRNAQTPDVPPTTPDAPPSQSDAPTTTTTTTDPKELVTSGDSSPAPAAPAPVDALGGEAIELDDGKPSCPHQAIIAMYHEVLPMLPRIREWTPARQQALRSRWREKPERQTPAWWREFFGYVAASDFLTGRSKRGNGHATWECSLPWLLKAENFAKVVEGHYENRGGA